MSNEIDTLERLLRHYEARMQEYHAKHGAGEFEIAGVEIGYQAEVRALRAALKSLGAA